jgi:hypothetical protein
MQGFTLGVDTVLALKGNENMGLTYDERRRRPAATA